MWDTRAFARQVANESTNATHSSNIVLILEHGNSNQCNNQNPSNHHPDDLNDLDE